MQQHRQPWSGPEPRPADASVRPEGGQRVAQIAPSVGRHPASGRRGLRAVNARELMVALYPQPEARGRPAPFGEQVGEGLVELRPQAPRELGLAPERGPRRDLTAAVAAGVQGRSTAGGPPGALRVGLTHLPSRAEPRGSDLRRIFASPRPNAGCSGVGTAKTHLRAAAL